MLPSKFFDPSRKDQNKPTQCAPPPLGMTGVMCTSSKLDIPNRGTIHYRVFRPRQIQYKAPLILIHGGPLIPCNYLLPLAYVVVDRAIVVYDQLGCGQSSQVASPSVLTTKQDNNNNDHRIDIEGMVHDLHFLMEHWNYKEYMLLGHSFGGILLFEYLKHCQRNQFQDKLNKCKAVVLASAPTSARIVRDEVQRLCQELITDDDHDDDNDQEEDDQEAVSALAQKVPKAFREQHECRMDPIPFPLVDSYNQAGPKHLRGLNVIGDYYATLEHDQEPSLPNKLLQVPALILRGQHDFVTEKCIQGWDELFRTKQHMTLAGCSHYGMLENETMYGSVVSAFLKDCE